MKRILALLLFMTAMLASPVLADDSGQSAKRLDVTVRVEMGYLLYLPKDYETKESWPLVLFLHGSGEPYWTERFKHLPVWAFHGAKDKGVPVERTQEMIDALTKEGGTPKLTIYPEAEHDSWTETYNNPEFYEWLLAQKRMDIKE